MAFNATSEYKDGIAIITLTGDLDASVAPELQALVATAATEKSTRWS